MSPARSEQRQVLAVWAALLLNVLTFVDLPRLLPVPTAVGQLVTQGAMGVALVLALRLNPRLVVRPTVLLSLFAVLALTAVLVSPHSEFLAGSMFRAVRLSVFVAVLWLLSPWWGRSDLLLLRSHLTCLRVVMFSVLAGAVLAPGAAFSFDGRLAGALWPIPTTQVAHYAAMLLGCTVIGWFCGVVTSRSTVLTVLGCGSALAATHTRTALVGLLLALALAGAGLFLGYVRVRRTAIGFGLPAVVLSLLFAPAVLTWASRGQSAQEAAQLTGRTQVWSAVADLSRPTTQQLFGAGLSDKSFDGLAVDSSWVATYLDLGWFGVLVSASFLVVLGLHAISRPPGPRRALAVFIVVYCLVASITETGLGDASPYLLELVVAGSLLAAPGRLASAAPARIPPRRLHRAVTG